MLLAGAFISTMAPRFEDLFGSPPHVIGRIMVVLIVAAALLPLAIFNINHYFSSSEPDWTGMGRFADTMIRKGYRLSFHLHPQYRRLGPSRIIDFLSYQATGKLYRHHTSIRQYYDYHEVLPDPWRTYQAGPDKIREAVEKAMAEEKPAIVIIDPTNLQAMQEALSELAPENGLESITALDERIIAYYFLVD